MKIERVDYGLTFWECVKLNDSNSKHEGFTPYVEQRHNRVSRITVSIDGALMFVERVTTETEWELTPDAHRWRMIQDWLLAPLMAKIRDDAYDGFGKQLQLLGVDTK